MQTYLVNIVAGTLDALRALDAFALDLKQRAARQEAPDRFVVPGILDEDEIPRVREAGYTVEVVEDLTEVAAARVQEVSRTNRFADGRGLEEFSERAVLGYMTVDEVESALSALQAQYPGLVTLITLPHRTWEGRTCHAVRVRGGSRTDRPGVLFTGSMHAREWGGSDSCIHFLIRLLNAYQTGNTLSLGGKDFQAQQVRTTVENLDIFVFPDVNPDGKHYSQSYDPASGQAQRFWWRKNRNPNGGSIGVDLNRNFDFLWNSGIGTSTIPSTNVYKGAAPVSEPETRNVRYLFDTYAHIRYFVDIHSFGGLILYSWGDDENQSIDTGQNFHNPAHDGRRGIVGDGLYREFVSTLDRNTAVGLARRMNNALTTVRGNSYTVQQAVGLYPTSGTSDDYAFSRHAVTTSLGKVYSYTIEFGDQFVPPYAEMQRVIDEVNAAMTELCWAANSDVYVRDHTTDSGAETATDPFWNSPDIWVRNANDGGTTHQNTIRGQDNFIFVRVHNRGLAEAHSVTVRVYLASFAGTQFVYPQDWIPRNAAGGGTITAPGTYLIGEAGVASLAPGAAQVVSVRWDRQLIPPAANWHPCLLVEVAPEDGLFGSTHVWENNNLGQKNITIVDARRGALVEFPFRVGNGAAMQPAGDLVVKKLRAPSHAAVFLDPKSNDLLPDLQPVLPIQPIRPPDLEPLFQPPTVGGDFTVTTLQPATIALNRPGNGDETWMVGLPAHTRIEVRGRPADRSLPPILTPQLPVLQPVVVGNRPLLSLANAQAGRLPLSLQPGTTKEMALRVAVPPDARTGDVYTFEAVQRDETGRPVGGVTLEVRVV